MDVADCHRARELCLERLPHLDPHKVRPSLWSVTLIQRVTMLCNDGLLP